MRRRRFKRSALLTVLFTALAAALGVAGCGPSAETLEAQRVLRAITLVRDAPSEPAADREKLVGDLEKLEIKGAIAARARDACAKAYRLLIEGKALQARVEKQLSPGDHGPGAGSGSGAAAGLDTLRDLNDAGTKLKESSEAMSTCSTAVVELRVGPGR